MYPKLRAKFGDSVPYDKAPKQHILVEFAFDVLLVAHGGYKLQAYHDFIGFKVAKPLLERAFKATYGLEMKDLFLSEDLAIGTYRHAVGSMIPDVTKVAWEKKQEEIQKTTPGAMREQFVLTLPRADYEQQYGKDYRKPGCFARILGVLYKHRCRKSGRSVRWRSRSRRRKRRRLFLDSLTRTRARYAAVLQSLRAGRLNLAGHQFRYGKAGRAWRVSAGATRRSRSSRSVCASEVDEAAPRVGAAPAGPARGRRRRVPRRPARAVPPRRRHEPHPRALRSRAGDDRIERLPDLRRQPQARPPPSGQPLDLVRGVLLLRAVLGEPSQFRRVDTACGRFSIAALSSRWMTTSGKRRFGAVECE